MKIYRSIWTCVAVCVTLLGLFCAPLVMTVAGMVATFVLTTLVAGAFAMSLTETWGGWRPVRLGLTTACAVVAGLGFMTALGPAGAALLLLLAASAPPVVDRIAAWGRGDSHEKSAGATAMRRGTASQREHSAAMRWSAERSLSGAAWMDGPPSEMDAASLCTAWRESYRSLQQPLSTLSRKVLVQRRQELLDELERRNPAQFAAWLDASNQPASQPGRYLFSRGRPDTPG